MPVIRVDESIYLPLVQTSIVNKQSSFEKELEVLFLNDKNQKHSKLERNKILDTVAQMRTDDMGLNDYFSHIHSNGLGIDMMCKINGFVFPDYYPVTKTSNHIESIAAGYISAKDVWNALAYESEAHSNHVLGKIDFFKKQTQYGLGYTLNPAGKFHHYWCILIAERK